LLEAETAVTAWTRARQVQVDIYLGVSKRPSTAVANRLAAMDHGNGHIIN